MNHDWRLTNQMNFLFEKKLKKGFLTLSRRMGT